MSQPRAKSGGETGVNGEWYAGGEFLPTTELGKMARAKKGGGGRKQHLEDNKWVTPPHDGLRSIRSMIPYHPDHHEKMMQQMNPAVVDVKGIDEAVGLYRKGYRWVNRETGHAYRHEEAMNLSASINLDRGTKGDEGHFVTIEHHVVFIPDDHGTGANGRGGKFTKHGLEKKLMKHHESRGGFATHEHRDALAEDSGGDLQGRSQFTFHKTLPGEVRKHIENNPAARKLFRVTSNASDAKGADALASLGDKYFDLADEAAGGHMTQAIASAEKSDDPEARFHAAIYTNLPKTKTAQGIIAPNKLHEGHTFTINGTKMSVVRTDEGLHLEGDGYPSTPVDALSEIPIDKHSLKMGKKSASVSKEFVPFSRAIHLARKELTGGRWVTIHPHGDEGDYRRLYIGGDGTIKAGPKAMIGKNISHTKDTHEVREADHPKSPLKKESSFTAQTVDPNRQLGMFAKNKDGSPMEVGEKPGQASLFHDTAKAKPVVDNAQVKRDEDAKATGEMFPGKKAEDATDRREKMIRDAQALRYLAVKMMPDDMPTRAQLRVSDATTKGDIDKFIMQKYGVEADVARDASNQGLTERGTHKLDGNKVTWTGGGDEPTAKTHPDVAKHIDSIIATASAKPETTSTPSNKIGRDTTPVVATKDEGPKLEASPAHRTAADIIAKQKKSDDVPESNDMDGTGMRDMGASYPKSHTEAGDLGIYTTTMNGETRYSVHDAKNNPRGFGDSLHATPEEAAKEGEWIKQRRADKEKMLANSVAKAKADADAKAKREDVKGFGEGNARDKGRSVAALSKMVRVDGVAKSVREHIEDMVAKGNVQLTSYEEPKIKPMTSRQSFRANNEEQQAHERKMRDAGTQTVHLVNGKALGKTAHDYAKHLMSKMNLSAARTAAARYLERRSSTLQRSALAMA